MAHLQRLHLPPPEDCWCLVTYEAAPLSLEPPSLLELPPSPEPPSLLEVPLSLEPPSPLEPSYLLEPFPSLQDSPEQSPPPGRMICPPPHLSCLRAQQGEGGPHPQVTCTPSVMVNADSTSPVPNP